MPRQARLGSPGTLHHVIVVRRPRELAEETKKNDYAWATIHDPYLSLFIIKGSIAKNDK